MKSIINQLQSLAGAKTFLKGLPEEAKKNLLIALKQEIKEEIEIPELEEENYKIDQHLSLEEKLNTLWEKEINVRANINGRDSCIHVIKKQIPGKMPDAFVWEYLNYVALPKELVGQQIFNRNAVINLGLETRLPRVEQMEAIKGNKDLHKGLLEKYIRKDVLSILPGLRNPYDKEFDFIGEWIDFRLVDGYNGGMNGTEINIGCHGAGFGFSVRLLKDK